MPSRSYPPRNEYAVVAKKVIAEIAGFTKQTSTAVLRDLQLRSDRSWKLVMSGALPSAPFHTALTTGALPLLRAHSAVKDSEFQKLHSVKIVRALIKSLDRLREEMELAIIGRNMGNAGATGESPITYAPEVSNPGAAGRAAQAAVQVAKKVDDVEGAQRVVAELGRARLKNVPDDVAMHALLKPLRERFKAAHADAGTRIIVQSKIAAIFEREGDWAGAVPELEKLIVLQEKIPDVIYAYQTHARLAKALASCNHRQREALDLLRRLSRAPKWKKAKKLDGKTAARVAEHLATARIEQGEFEAARQSLREALKFRLRIGNPVGIGSVWFYRARCALREQKWRDAYAHLAAAADRWTPLQVRELDGRLQLCMAQVMVGEFSAPPRGPGSQHRKEVAQLEGAAQAVEKALKYFASDSFDGDIPTERANALQTRGRIRFLLNPSSPAAVAAAIADYENSLSLCFDVLARAHAYRVLADLYCRIGDPAGAAKNAQHALDYLRYCGRLSSEDSEQLGQLIGNR